MGAPEPLGSLGGRRCLRYITAVPLRGEGVESSHEVLQALVQTRGREWLELL